MKERNLIALVLVFIIVGAFIVDIALGLASFILLFPVALYLAGRITRVVLFVMSVFAVAFLATYAITANLFTGDEALGSANAESGHIAVSILLAVAGVFVAFYVLLYVSSEWVLGLSEQLGVTRQEAIKTLVTRTTGMQYPYIVVADGEQQIVSRGNIMTTFGGPGVVVVRELSAAIMERVRSRDAQVRIIGPGTTRTGMFEQVKGSVDLRKQEGESIITDATTQEGVPLTFTIRYYYQIETEAQRQEREKPPQGVTPVTYPAIYPGKLSGSDHHTQDAVGRAIYHAPSGEWKEATEHAIESIVSNIVDNYSLVQIFGDPRNPMIAQSGILQEMATKARTQAWSRTAEWGVSVTAIDIMHVQVPAVVQDRIGAMWQAEAESDSTRRKSQGEVAAYEAIEGVRTAVSTSLANSFQAAIYQASQTLPSSTMPAYLSLLSRIAEEVGKDRITAYRYFQTLEAMSRNPNTSVIINTGDNPIIVEPKKPN